MIAFRLRLHLISLGRRGTPRKTEQRRASSNRTNSKAQLPPLFSLSASSPGCSSTRPSCCLFAQGGEHEFAHRKRERKNRAPREFGTKTKTKCSQHPMPARLAGERRVALCVKNWSSDASLVTWAFVKNWFLRVREGEERRREERTKRTNPRSKNLRPSRPKKNLFQNRNAAPRTAPTRSPRWTGSISFTSGAAGAAAIQRD